MDFVIITYFAYLALSIALIVWAAQTLHKSGRIFHKAQCLTYDAALDRRTIARASNSRISVACHTGTLYQ